MASIREIDTKVAKVLAECLGVDEGTIRPSATLRDDLGAESIDLLDIVFRLEREFGIKIPRGELFPDLLLEGNPEFVRDGRVTDEGLVEVRSQFPYADLGDFERHRRLVALADLFTVDLVVRYVDWKLGRGNQAVPADRTRATAARESPAARRSPAPGRSQRRV